MDIDQELTTLDNLQAAPLDEPHPEQEEPFQHLPEDVVKNVEKVEIAIPQDDLSLENMISVFQEIQSAKERLKQTGKISSLEAQEIARFVPEVMGTETDPVSFTSIPTSVGVEQTQEALDNKEQNLIEDAKEKMKKLIEETVKEASVRMMVLDKDYTPTLLDYNQAREQFRKSTGDYPEYTNDIYVGDVPLNTALVNNYPNMRSSEAIEGSAKYKVFHEALREAVGHEASFAHVFLGSGGGYVQFTDQKDQYPLDTLSNKSLATTFDLNVASALNDKSLLLIGLTGGHEDRFKKVIKAVEGISELLTSFVDSISGETLEKIKQVTLGVNVINTLLRQAEAFIQVLRASSSFMTSLSGENSNTELSAAMESVLPIDKPRRFIARKTPMFARLLRGA